MTVARRLRVELGARFWHWLIHAALGPPKPRLNRRRDAA